MDERGRSKGTAATGVNSGAGDAGKKEEDEVSAPVKWVKRTFAVVGALASIGGALALISQTTHWLGGLGGTSTQASQFEVSPNLGISFHQNGQLDPMFQPGDQGTVTVSMKSEPFELWFPTLAKNESVEVCAATGNWVFSSAARTGQKNVFSCLTPGMGVAAGPYGGGFLVLATPGSPASTNISEARALPAAQGDEKYYVSNLTSGHSRIYLVIYRYSVNEHSFPGNPPFNAQHTEDFILDIG